MTAVAVELPAPVRVEIPAARFISAVKAVSVAASSDQALPVLASVSITVLERGLVLAATDRYRLTEARHGIGEPVGAALVNARELTDYVKAIKLPKRELVPVMVSVEINAAGVTVIAGELSRTFRTYDSQFPPYAHLLPSDSLERGGIEALALDEGYLAEGAKACALMNSGKGVILSLYAGDRKPVLMRPRTVIEGWSYFYLLMPQRLES